MVVGEDADGTVGTKTISWPLESPSRPSGSAPVARRVLTTCIVALSPLSASISVSVAWYTRAQRPLPQIKALMMTPPAASGVQPDVDRPARSRR
jgi:hypothetical protein